MRGYARKVRNPPTRANDPEGLRRRILDAAAKLFLTNGFNATSMIDLLSESGASRGALYYHFPTKKVCALHVIREHVAPIVREVWTEPLRKAKSTEDGVLTILLEIADRFDAAGRVAGCPLSNLSLELSPVDPEYRSAIQAVFDEWRTALVEKIRIDVAAGRLRADIEPADLATMITAAYSGAVVLAGAEQDTRPLRQCARQLSVILEQAGQRNKTHGCAGD